MKLLIEVDKKYKRLFLETAKAVHGKMQEVDEKPKKKISDLVGALSDDTANAMLKAI